MNKKYLSDLSKQFEDKIVIVTGSTQGNGAETAKLLAHRGAKGITICGRKEKEGYVLKYRKSTGLLRRTNEIHAKKVIFSGGVMGSGKLLLKCKDQGYLS